MEKDEIEAAVLLAIEVSLEAQLKAVRRLRAGPREAKAPRKGTSQIDMVHDVLRRAGKPLHISSLSIEQVRNHAITVGDHCYACTAGAGSSCGGTLV